MKMMLILMGIVMIAIIAFQFAPKGWRTYVFNALSSLPIIGLPVTDAIIGFDWSAIVDKAEAATYALGVTIANVVFRTITNTPPAKKD
jgi:hypothetical protein